MTYEEREQLFLEELTKLTHKYRITISGCGCCGSPSLDDVEDLVDIYSIYTDPRWQKHKLEDVAYTYKDQLSYDKVI